MYEYTIKLAQPLTRSEVARFNSNCPTKEDFKVLYELFEGIELDATMKYIEKTLKEIKNLSEAA
tara:strand:+ start:2977 stop:3168 length:192 start_codon:yes stop_codon:yes gene_type:complete